MKKILFFLLILFTVSMAQDEVITVAGFTHRFDSTAFNMYQDDTMYVWISLPNRFDYTTNTTYKSIVADSVGTKPSTFLIPYQGDNYWNGNFYVGIYPVFASGAMDSLQVSYSPIDNLGKVFTNDVRYLDFSDGTSADSPKWKLAATTASVLGASSYGESVPVCGYRFMIIQKATTCAPIIKFKIWKN
jgi:hypothetical protein